MLNGVLLLLQLIVLNIRKSALKTESLAILLLNFSMTVKVPSKSTKLLIRLEFFDKILIFVLDTKEPEHWKLFEHGLMANFQVMKMTYQPPKQLQPRAKLLILTPKTSNPQLLQQNKSVLSNSLLHGADIVRKWLQLGLIWPKILEMMTPS